MGEEDHPFVADELVEVDGAVAGVGPEIGSSRPEAEAGDLSAPPMLLSFICPARGRRVCVMGKVRDLRFGTFLSHSDAVRRKNMKLLRDLFENITSGRSSGQLKVMYGTCKVGVGGPL